MVRFVLVTNVIVEPAAHIGVPRLHKGQRLSEDFLSGLVAIDMFAIKVEPNYPNNFVDGETGKTCETLESKPHKYWKAEVFIAQEDWISTKHRGNTSNERGCEISLWSTTAVDIAPLSQNRQKELKLQLARGQLMIRI